MAELDFKKSGQDKALEFIGKDMLVSASAGSGKTTVMVKKILLYLEKGDITRLIVLTFTKESANDMREKLMEKLSEEARKGGPNAEHYREQLNRMPFAYIGTIDAICGEIYKRYFEEIGLPPTLDMLSKEERGAFINTAIEEVFQEYIKNDDEGFNLIASLYGNAKGFDGVKAPIIKLLDFLVSQENHEEFFRFAIEEAEKPFLKCRAVKEFIAIYRKRFGLYGDIISNLYAELNKLGLAPPLKAKYTEKLNELDDIASRILHADDEGIYKYLRDIDEGFIKIPTVRNLEGEAKQFHEKLKTFNNNFKESFLAFKGKLVGEKDEIMEKDGKYAKVVLKLINIVKDVQAKYAEIKIEEGKSDFEDVERAALKIFENDKIAEEFRDSIDFIFLDEYQDTNRLQEAIFRKIARDNLFMVGDVKQAIYGFRAAEPRIFIEKFERYQRSEEGKNVPLNKNFRSDQAVLSFIDKVFSEIMTYDFGGVDYKNESCFGESGLARNQNGPSPEVEVAFFEREKEEKDEGVNEVYSVKCGKRDFPLPTREEQYIVEKITSIVGKEVLFDRAIGKERPIEYGDICILYRARRCASGLKKLLKESSIPFIAKGFEEDRITLDVDAINTYLRVIDNPLQDVYLGGAMLSHFGGFSEDELAQIRAQNYSLFNFYEAVLAYEGALKDKIEEFFSQLERYKELSSVVNVPTLIETVMVESGYLSALLAEGHTARIETYNSYLHAIKDKKFSDNLQNYVAFLNSNVPLEIPEIVKTAQAVNIMTMHGSKGLEFPVVFCPSMQNEVCGGFTSRDALTVDAHFGIGINVFDEETGEKSKSGRRNAIEEGVFRKESQEALRLLYVAFTRARYRLYVTGTGKTEISGLMISERGKSFMEWLLIAEVLNSDIEIKRFSSELKEDSDIGGVAEEKKTYGEKEISQGTSELTYLEYPYLESTLVSNKYSVTALNTKDKEEGTFIPSLEAQNVEKGVAYHKVMELIDFNLASCKEVSDFINALEGEGIIEKGVVDATIIYKTLKHPLMDVARRGTCLREQEFIYYAPACDVLPNVRTDDRVLIQGVMDLIIEGEENVLIDYKVSGSSLEDLKERYRTQIALYGKAYEEMTGKKLSRKAVLVLNRGEVIEF